MSVPPLKRSNTEFTMNNNVVSLENINDVNESCFQRTTHKGKLFKGPNWTAYNKENLGCIPRKIEKSLVEDKKSITKVGFFTQTERFYPRNQTMKLNPGPGSYNVSTDNDMTRTQTSFYSSKGFGNGFVSAAERFDDSILYQEKYAPGPGEYMADKTKTMQYDIQTSLLGKSLYSNKKTQSLKAKSITPAPDKYNPMPSVFDQASKNHNPDAVFKSTVNRFVKKDKFKVPGPGKYFKDENYYYYNEPKTEEKNSYYFQHPHSPKRDLLKEFDIKTVQEKEDAQFKLKDKKGRIIKNQEGSDVDFLTNCRKAVNPYAMTNKLLHQLNNKTFLKESKKPPSAHKEGSIMINNLGIDSEKGMEYVHRILKKPPKPDLFALNSQRWQINELEFKVPGPAYYDPRKQESKLSFNRNNEDFIVTAGVVNKHPDDVTYFN